MSKKNKYWHLEGEELEEHLSYDCRLSIIEPMQTLEYYTQEERELIDQFPFDRPEVPEYDEVLREPVSSETGKLDLNHRCAALNYTPVGEVFQTAVYWCLRVRHG